MRDPQSVLLCPQTTALQGAGAAASLHLLCIDVGVTSAVVGGCAWYDRSLTWQSLRDSSPVGAQVSGSFTA